MISVPEAARRLGRNPETVRRWVREGRLASTKVGTQHMLEESDVNGLRGSSTIPLPAGWRSTVTGETMPDWVEIVRRSRSSH